jgi:endoglucanase
MKKLKLLLLFVPLIFIACSEDSGVPEPTVFTSAVSRHGEISVSNGKLVNSEGISIQLCGMSTHGLNYFDNFYTKNAIKALGSSDGWRADILRVSLYAREGGYEKNPSYYTERVDSLVEWASAEGLYVLIDWHQLAPGDPNLDIENAKIFFEHMAMTHGSKPNILFDICNEPNSDGAYDSNWEEIPLGYTVTWNNHIKPYAETIIPIIRKYSDNIVIVGTEQYSSRPDLVIGNELSFDNVMYAMHFYAASHGATFRNYVTQAVNAKIPVFVTEFGTQNYSGEGDNSSSESNKWLSLLKTHKISWCNWNYSNDWRSGAVFKTYVNESDSLLYAENDGQWWNMSSEDQQTLSRAERVEFSSVEDFYNRSNMKEAGQYIMDQLWNRTY